MRYVKLRELAAMPPGTVFSRWEPEIVTGLYQLTEPCADLDFFYTDLLTSPPCMAAGEVRPETPEGYPLMRPADATGRWGIFDENEEFVIYEPADIDRVVGCLVGRFREVLAT